MIPATDLHGTWRLLCAASDGSTGPDDAPYGPDPSGLLIYSPDGRMMAIISHSGRQVLASGDRISASVEERAQAFATFFSYAGRYSFADGRLLHHVEIASVQNWVGTDLVRLVTLTGNRMTLTTTPLSVGGNTRTTSLVWERLTVPEPSDE